MCCPSGESYYILIVIQLQFDMHVERELADVLPLVSLYISTISAIDCVHGYDDNYYWKHYKDTARVRYSCFKNYCIVIGKVNQSKGYMF